MDVFDSIRQEIIDDPENAWAKKLGYLPIYTASATARIVVVSQAPGRHAQDASIPWHDKSGETLRAWLGVTDEQFYDESLFSFMPMDFYFPGKGKSGDKPPRKDFAATWHPKLLAHMPNVQLILLIGQYAQAYYLGDRRGRTLTDTVRDYEKYLPRYFPLVHPSPLNIGWQMKNPWFAQNVVPELQIRVEDIIT